MIIDCGTCAVAGLACDDCVVSVLLGAPSLSLLAPDEPSPWGAVTDVDDEHAAALGVLAESGLVPPLRLVPRSQAS
jgi:hypothetical protein